MKTQLKLFGVLIGLIVANLNAQNTNNGKELIKEMVNKVGDYDYLKSLKDVEFTYTFFSPASRKKDVSIERYIFNDEISWAKYNEHDVFVYPKTEGEVIQWYDGKQTSFAAINNVPETDEKQLSSVRFLRKANYYWFTMMPKLLDEGLTYEVLEDRRNDGLTYKMVKIGFNNGVGDVQDEFVLYVNPKTKLIDQFLFTVKGSRLPSVMLMKIEYATVNGYTFMAKRQVISADWDGNEKGDLLFEQTTADVKFNNGFTKALLLN